MGYALGGCRIESLANDAGQTPDGAVRHVMPGDPNDAGSVADASLAMADASALDAGGHDAAMAAMAADSGNDAGWPATK